MKRLLGIFLLLAAMSVFCASAVAEAAPPADLTLMVYMCGSNLESSCGAASADLEEMMDTDFDSGRVKVLVMTGGTKEWDLGLDADQVSILKISPGRQVTVWKSDTLMDMSDGETLTYFMRYCAEQYPADNYALILWDHGGGPLEGVCWDELFSMNHMKYPELVSAIRSAHLGKKLSWIGFDACLMSSLEIASDLSGVAEYMIASQETEPADGWNYSFLDGIEEDRSAAGTGRRIVDAFFEGREDSHDTLTLACTDLSKAAVAAETLGLYFRSVEQDLSSATFPALAGLRMSSASFGEGVRSVEGDEGYDLVDARDLVRHMEKSPKEKEQLLALLDECVIYNRSNEETASGLTLYHPYSNKEKFLSGWKKRYEAMDLIGGYTEYIRSFGTLLTGADLVRWCSLYTNADGTNSAGEPAFSVKLNEEQAAHFASAQLLIVRDTGNTVALGGGVAIVSASHAVLSGDGILTGSYDETALYVERENGSLLGPLSYIQTDSGRFDVVTAGFIPNGEYDFSNAKSVLFYLEAADRSTYPEIYRTRIWDDATQNYSTRLPFDESRYRMATFWNRNKSYPGEKDGVLPEFNIWKNGSLSSLFELPLPEAWRFTRQDAHRTGAQLYAMFQITDVQQNVYCSVPVAVDNPNLVPFGISGTEQEIPDAAVSLSGLIDKSEQQSVRLLFTLVNRGEDGDFSVKDFVINGSREVPESSVRVHIPAGGKETVEVNVGSESLAFLDEAAEVAFTLLKEIPDGKTQSTPVRFGLQGCDLSLLAPYTSLGHGEQDRISMDIVKISPDTENGLEILILVENQREETLYPDTLLVNGLELDSHCTESVSPGNSRVIRCCWEDGLALESMDLSIPENPNAYYITHIVTNLLALHGQSAVSELAVTFKDSISPAAGRFFLPATAEPPVPVTGSENPGAYNITLPVLFPPEAGENTAPALLSETGRWRVQLRRIILGGAELLVVLDVTNKTDQFIDMLAEDLYINGSETGSAVPSVEPLSNTFTVAPGGTRTVTARLKRHDGLDSSTQVETLSLTIRAREDCAVSPALITLHKPASTGSLVWISPEQADIQPAQVSEAEEGEIVSLSGEILLPENAEAYRTWIEAPVSEEEMISFEEGRMLLVSYAEDSILSVITYQQMTVGENGKAGAWFPGLVACSALDETDLIPVVLEQTEKDGITARVLSKFSLENDDYLNYQYKVLNTVRFSVRYGENRAFVTETESSGDDITDGTAYITWLAYLVKEARDSSGKLPWFSSMERVSDLYLGWQEVLNGNSFRIMLRPVLPEDELYVLFSVMNRDGDGYSILLPYEKAMRQ